jgi:hypothetical protein
MGFLSFGRSREGKRNASYSIFTFWYWLPSGYVVTKVHHEIANNGNKDRNATTTTFGMMKALLSYTPNWW